VRRKTAVLGGLYTWSLICMATALSRTFPQLLFFRAAEGLGETFYFPASISPIGDYHGKRSRSRAMGMHQTSVYIGTIAGGFFGGRIFVQMLGLLGAAPFVIWCGQTLSLSSIIMALTAWGLFKGMYDANIFASALDVVRPEARGTAVGFMNMTGWLFGAATAPLFIGVVAEHSSLGLAISLAAIALFAAAVLLLIAMTMTLRRDVERMSAELIKPEFAG
jgi:MFS family permease